MAAASSSSTITPASVPGLFSENDQSLTEALQFRKQLLERSSATPSITTRLSEEQPRTPPHARSHTEPYFQESSPSPDRVSRTRVFSVDEMIDSSRCAGAHPHPPMLVRPVATRATTSKSAVPSAAAAAAPARQFTPSQTEDASALAHALEQLAKRSSLPSSRSLWSQEVSVEASCASSWSFGTPPASRPPSLTPSTSHDERDLYSTSSSPNSLRSFDSVDSDVEALQLAPPFKAAPRELRPRDPSQQLVRKLHLFDHPRVPGLTIQEATLKIDSEAEPLAFVAHMPPHSRGWKALLSRDSKSQEGAAKFELRRSPGLSYSLVKNSTTHADFLLPRRLEGVKEWTFPKFASDNEEDNVQAKDFVWRLADVHSQVMLQLFSPTKALVASYTAVSNDSGMRGTLQIIPAPVQLVSDVVAPLQARDLLDKARQEAAPPAPEIIILTLLGVLHAIGAHARSPTKRETIKATDMDRSTSQPSSSGPPRRSTVIESGTLPLSAQVIFPAFNAKLSLTPQPDASVARKTTARVRADSDLSHLSERNLQRAVERSPSKASRRATCVAGARPPGPIRVRPRSRVPSVCDAFISGMPFPLPSPPSPSYTRCDPFAFAMTGSPTGMLRTLSAETAETSASESISESVATACEPAAAAAIPAPAPLSEAECVREAWRTRQRQEEAV